MRPNRISLANQAASKKRVLEEAAVLLATGLEELTTEQVFERLLERERLGSTGLAGGVALPHARMPGVTDARGAFLSLAKAVEFDATDGQPVDLIFALLVPESATEEHLQLLADLAKLFSEAAFCERLRHVDASAVIPMFSGDQSDDGQSDKGSGSLQLPA